MYLKGVAKFVGSACTADRYPLVVAGRYNTPYVLHCKHQGKVRLRGASFPQGFSTR